jgi:SAM-dependent methyltransferase
MNNKKTVQNSEVELLQELESPDLRHYSESYEGFASKYAEEIRRETFGEDIGQYSWLTADELDRFISWLQLKKDAHVLDIACGSGGPAIQLVKRTGCRLHGIDIQEHAIEHARGLSGEQNLSERVTFDCVDVNRALPFTTDSFDAVICIDAVSHFANRGRVILEWARVLRPGGTLLFTDATVVTGSIRSAEIAARSSVGYMTFVPPGEDERLIEAAGLQMIRREDVTQTIVDIAGRWRRARAVRARVLRPMEGEQAFDTQQKFFQASERLAAERRLSRFVFVARKPA